MRLVFLGTPDFAVPTLELLAQQHEIALVIAQPDKPAGRGMKLHAPPVAVKARELGLPLIQPARIRAPEALEAVLAASADVGIVIAYGKILPAALLEMPKHGFLNVHASVLPRWRGAAPIQRAIEAGDPATGVTIMRVDEELDHGPMLAIESTEIGSDERTPSLSRRLSTIGAEALARVLDDLARGAVVETEQNHAEATHAPKIEKQEGEVRWGDRAKTIYDKFRAFDPWPGVFVHAGGEVVKLTEIAPTNGDGEAGKVLAMDPHGVVIATGDGALRLVELQRPGKPRTAAAEVARGLGWRIGSIVK